MKFFLRLTMFFLCLLIVRLPVLAEESQNYAEALSLLGIFSGTGRGFELERVPTRAEALAMVIRLIGKEQEALSAEYPNPFSDMGWEEKYAAFGFWNNLIKGISEDSFGGGREITLKQYSAMLLRVLGYSESEGDFTYENSISFVSLVLGKEISGGEFNRGKMAQLSCYTLNTRMKNSSITLGKKLSEEGVFSSQALIDAQRLWEQEREYSRTTVLIYAVGSDLESQQGRLSKDLEEILRGEPKANCTVLIQTGGTRTFHNEFMTNGRAERFSVIGGSLQRVDGSIHTGAAAPETLTDFIRWGVSEAPAERYILVLWDHGYGFMGGFGADELNGRKTMKVSELSYALENAGVFFDIIAFDACLMGTAEIAYALRNNAKFIIASEDSTPACGLYYTTWIGALERNPAIGTERLGRVMLDSFILHAGIEANIPATISMMRTSLAERLICIIAEYKGDLGISADGARLLGENEGVFDQFDLLQIMKDAPEILAAAQALAFEVRNSVHGKEYGGLAMYVPSRRLESAWDMRDELIKLNFPGAYIDKIFSRFKGELQ